MGKEKEKVDFRPITRDEVLILMPHLMEYPEQFERFYDVIKMLDVKAAREVIKILMS